MARVGGSAAAAVNVAALSFRDLEYVVSVADHLHFGRAALACAVSQPTLSAQVRKFEDYVGVVIFERTPRAVLVTERGGEIVGQARAILREGARLYEIARVQDELLSGTFRLGLIASLGPYLTPLLLQSVRADASRLNLVLSEGPTQPLVEGLTRGDLDAVLATSPLHGPEFMELPTFAEDLVLAVPRHHRLATLDRVHLADIDADELILLDEGHCLRTQVLALFPSRGGRIGRQASSIESVRQMVGAGLGCALLPQLSVQIGALLDDMVAYRVIQAAPPRRSISTFYRASFSRTRDVRALRTLLRAALRATGDRFVDGPSEPGPAKRCS